jgi:hypothetical protein
MTSTFLNPELTLTLITKPHWQPYQATQYSFHIVSGALVITTPTSTTTLKSADDALVRIRRHESDEHIMVGFRRLGASVLCGSDGLSCGAKFWVASASRVERELIWGGTGSPVWAWGRSRQLSLGQ